METNFNPKNLNLDVLVLGAGISGLSTAIVLEAMGLKVGIVSETTPLKSKKDALVSNVPTNYAMASAYPHFLRVEGLQKISDITQSTLKQLHTNTNSGINIHQVFEVFEYEPADAPLKERRMDFKEFSGKPSSLTNSFNPPFLKNAKHLWGWVFDSYFCDLPVYIPFLWSIFEANGGKLFNATIDKKLLESIPDDILVANCLGYGAVSLYDDSKPARIQRGCQILLKDAPLIKNERGIPKSFNYYPTKEVFPRNENEAEYLHFFSRSDGWLLGQTREPGVIDDEGNWVGETVTAEHFDVSGTLIPKAILDLNIEILENWGYKSSSNLEMEPRIGFRYYRDPDHFGVRLEKESCFGNKTIHNYAHGGSGITMSWGCAFRAAQILTEATNQSSFDISKKDQFSKDLQALNELFSCLA